MSTRYVVKQGDNLSRIASTFHLRSWAEIYNDPENAEFRRRRPNPNLILVGDVLMVPDPPGVFNHLLPAPPHVQQANTYWCWAAATESWLTVTDGRDPVSQGDLRTMFQSFTDASNGGLTPAGWGALATRFNMEARMFTAYGGPGSSGDPSQISPKLIYETLKRKGFIIIVYNLMPGFASHTNVIYGIQSNSSGTTVNVMDPESADKSGGLLTRPLSHYTSRDFVGLLWAR
jgi:hypothetical protein